MSEIKHDTDAQEFYVETPEGRALLHYERDGNTLNFHHTFVPPPLRGKGLAEKIVSAGFEYAEKNNMKVISTCPYVARLVMKNSDWKKLVVME
ncbi:MAG: N-acetyltransferase [Candidatus Omnitrophica bacterium]|nr:N-acetyltransferase [Candidatus Omnitrophota bacterium]